MTHLAAWLVLTPPSLWAADVPLLSAPTVTDDGVYTTSTATLHATWSSAGMPLPAEYLYLVRQDSPAGPIVVSWTPVGGATSMTRTGLTLFHGTTYYIGVKARYALAVESAVGYSDGIAVDTESPTPRIADPADGTVFGRH